MKKLIAVMCFMLATSPLALAQDKGRVDEKKAAPAAEKSAKGAKKGVVAGSGVWQPTEKQKPQQEKMGSATRGHTTHFNKAGVSQPTEIQKAQQEKSKSISPGQTTHFNK